MWECFLYIIFSGIFGLRTVFLLPFEIHCSYLIKSPPLHSEVKLCVQYFHLDGLALQPDSFKTPSRLRYQLLASSRVTVMAPEVVMGAPKILLLNQPCFLLICFYTEGWLENTRQTWKQTNWVYSWHKIVTFKKSDKRINFVRAFFTQKQTWFTTQKLTYLHFSYFQVGNFFVCWQ